MVDPGDGPGNAELLTGEKADREIVLVVARGRHDHIRRFQRGLLEAAELAHVGDLPDHAGAGTILATTAGSWSRIRMSCPP